MAQKKHKSEEIAGKLPQVDVLVSQGRRVAEAIRVRQGIHHGDGPTRVEPAAADDDVHFFLALA